MTNPNSHDVRVLKGYADKQYIAMITMPTNIDDALDIEPLVRDIYASWQSLPVDHRVQETLCNSDFYQSMQTCKQIMSMLDNWRDELDTLGIDNRYPH